MNINMQ